MSVNSFSSLDSIKCLEENQIEAAQCKGLYQFYFAMRARDLPTLKLKGLSCREMILRIEEWLNSTDFSRFTHLSLVNQGLTFIPEQIDRFKNLTWLNLAGNKLKKLPDSMSQLTQLEHLDIAQNKFSHRPQVLDHLVSLKYIFDNYNRS